jgi:hypothetical protein
MAVTNITVASGNRIADPSLATTFAVTVNSSMGHYIFAYREESTGTWVQSALINQTVSGSGSFNHTVAANTFNRNRRYEIAVQVMTQIPSPATTNETYTGPQNLPPNHGSGQTYLQKVTQSVVDPWYVKVFIVQPATVVKLNVGDEQINVVSLGQSTLASPVKAGTGSTAAEVNVVTTSDPAASKVRTVQLNGTIVAMAKAITDYTPGAPGLANYNAYSNYSEYLDGTFTSNFTSRFSSLFPSRFSSLFPSRFSSLFPTRFTSIFNSRFTSLFPSRFSSLFPSRFSSLFPSVFTSNFQNAFCTNFISRFSSNFPSRFSFNFAQVW